MDGFRVRPADNNVAGRLALVTGASGGLGSCCAEALAAEGCDVAIHYSSNKDSALSLSTRLTTLYPAQHFPTIQADLASPESTSTLVPRLLAAAAPKHAAVSILVANAGIGRRIRDVASIADADWDAMMEVNARSQFVTTRACVEGMRRQGWGRVVLMGSIAARGGGLNGCHYAGSKGALTSMGLNLANLLAGEGVTVNIVAPAMICDTGMIPTPKATEWPAGKTVEQVREEDLGLAIAADSPVKRLGQPQEVANVVIMFVKTGYITGQEILVSGGLK